MRQRDAISEFKYFLSAMNDTVMNQSEKILHQERKIEDLEERLNKQTGELKLLTEASFG